MPNPPSATTIIDLQANICLTVILSLIYYRFRFIVELNPQDTWVVSLSSIHSPKLAVYKYTTDARLYIKHQPFIFERQTPTSDPVCRDDFSHRRSCPGKGL